MGNLEFDSPSYISNTQFAESTNLGASKILEELPRLEEETNSCVGTDMCPRNVEFCIKSTQGDETNIQMDALKFAAVMEIKDSNHQEENDKENATIDSHGTKEVSNEIEEDSQLTSENSSQNFKCLESQSLSRKPNSNEESIESPVKGKVVSKLEEDQIVKSIDEFKNNRTMIENKDNPSPKKINKLQSNPDILSNKNEEVVDEFLNPPTSTNIQIVELEDEIENHPKESLKHLSEDYNNDAKYKSIKPKDSKIRKKGGSDGTVSKTDMVSKEETMPNIKATKQKKKNKSERKTVVSKPLGLVTPLEKRKKRVNYLEMHT